MKPFAYKKAVQALNYFAIQSGGTINKMKALKLIWLADRYHLRNYGRTITGDNYFAMKNGPVASATKDVLNDSSFLDDAASKYAYDYICEQSIHHYKSIHSCVNKVFSKTDLEAITTAFELYGDEEHFNLSEFSHEFEEWKKHKFTLESPHISRVNMSFDDFFSSGVDDKKMFDQSEEKLSAVKDYYLAHN